MAAMFVCCLFLYWIFQYIKDHPVAHKILGVAPVLSQQYNDDNYKWFEAKLPKSTKVFYGEADGNVADVYTVGGEFVIEINPKYNRNPSQEMFSLLHEECHIKTWNENGIGHGPIFQACMFNLASRGAFSELW